MNRAGRLLRWIAALVLGAWMAALAVAAVKLDAWNDDLVHTLLQIRADATLRERMRQQEEPIPREWYRSKTLALLAAAERLQEDTAWTIAIPGSWRLFDNLEERVGLRLERAFSEIAVETMRREIHLRAAQLTGVPLDSITAELMAGKDCVSPRAPPAGANAAAVPYELAEFVAVQDYLAQVAQLDQALQAMSALREPGPAGADHLRSLVRYTLGAQLPGRLARSTGFVRRGLRPAEAAQAALSTARLQQAARCSLARAMGALDARLFERNDLLAAEAHLAQRMARLFGPGARLGAPGDMLQALHEVVAALEQQEALLAHGDYAWLHSATPSLGPAHEKLLASVEGIALMLGPDAADQVRRQSAQALQRFRGRFAAAFRGGGQPSLVWAEGSGRLVPSPERLALREDLAALLKVVEAVSAADAQAAPDAGQRERLAKVRRLLVELGARHSAQWLRASEVKVPESPSEPRA